MSMFSLRPIHTYSNRLDALHSRRTHRRHSTLLKYEWVPFAGQDAPSNQRIDAAHYYTKHFQCKLSHYQQANVSHWGMTHNNLLV